MKDRNANSQESYKPLTPEFREEINTSINDNIDKLKTCQPNAFVSSQLIALNATKNLINALPDGYPLPITYRR